MLTIIELAFQYKDNMERICKNCQLFCSSRGICGVTIIHEGVHTNIPVSAEDPCFFEEEYFNPVTRQKEDFNDIQQLRMYEEKGQVKIEYPNET